MENDNTSSNTQPTETASPPISLPAVETPQLKNNKGLITFLVILVLILASTTAYFAYKSSLLSNQLPAQETTETYPKISDTPSPSPTITSNERGSLQSILAENCSDDDTIDISLLPFILNDNIVNKYNISNTTSCHWGLSDGDRFKDKSTGSVRLENREDNLPTSTLKIGTIHSQDDYYGKEDFANFDSIESDLTIKNTKIAVDILQPGPFGVSSNGIWLEVRAYKKLGKYLIISKEFATIEVEGEIKNLMTKYTDNMPDEIPEGFPEHTVNQKYDQFKQEFFNLYFASYPNISQEYKDMVDNTISDVSGISNAENL